jgi:hypothetical protein
MSADAETLQLRIDQLDKDIASGTLIVRHGETMRQARSLSEMRQIRADLQEQLDGLTSPTRRRRVRYLYQSGKGL